MAKLLKFGISYIPKKSVINAKTGEKKEISCVNLALYLDDKAGPAAFYEIKSFMRDNVSSTADGTINIMIPEDKFNIFVNGKLFNRILSVVEQTTDYIPDANSIAELPNRFARAKEEVENAKNINLDVVTNQYIQDLISGIEKDFNDPRFQQIMDAINVFSYSNVSNISGTYNDSNIVLQETKLTPENVVKILAQWYKAGRQGIPTYLATENQWVRFFGGKVRPDALKLYAVRPDRVAGVSPNTVARQLGIDPNTATQGGAITRGIHSIARGGGMDRWRGIQSSYAMVCYYDVSDVDNVDPNALTGDTANVYDPNAVNADSSNTPDNADANNAAQDGIVGNDVKMAEDIIKKKLIKYANDNNIDGLKIAIQRGGVKEGLTYLIGRLKPIFRDRDAAHKKEVTELVLLFLLRKFDILPDEINILYKKHLSKLRTPQGAPNQKLIISLSSMAANIFSTLNGIKESFGNAFTLEDGVRFLGFTMDDFKRMPKTEEEIIENINNVRESFKRDYKKLLLL